MSEHESARKALAAFNAGEIDVFYSISAKFISSYVSDLESRLEKAEAERGAARNDGIEEAAKAIEAQLPFGHEKGARWNLDGLNKLARTAALIRDLKDGPNGEA